MNSLEQRLTAGLAGSLLVLLVLFWFLVNATIRTLAEDVVASRLIHDAESLVAAVDFVDGTLQLEGSAVGGIYRRAYSGHYYVVVAGDGRDVSRSLWDTQFAVEPVPVGESRRWQLDGPLGQRLLAYAGGYLKQGQRFTVAVAEDISPLATSLGRFNIGFALLTGIAGVLVVAVQRGIVRRSFRTLDGVRTAIVRLESGEIERLPESVPTEVRPLVAEVNRLLAQMSRKVERSRTAVGNLAHALKGPLNVLVRSAERHGEDVREPVERVRGSIERELRRARIVGAAAPGRRFRAAEEMPTLVRLLQQVHAEKVLAIDWEVEGEIAPVDRDDMLELLGNLLDNAGKWAANQVHCRLVGNEAETCVVVEDDGPGCDESALAELTARGRRVDESVPGHGLGLAIVRDIVDSYGAELRFGRSPLGGMRVEVTFPNRKS